MNWFSVHRVGAEAFASIGNDIGCDGPGVEQFVEAVGDASKVHIQINSHGGSMSAGLDLADFLKTRETHAIVIERCFSAAIPPLLAARRRCIRADATVMVHKACTAAYGGRDELHLAIEGLAEANARLFELLRERTGRTRFEIAEWLRGDRYFSATEAVEVGIADSIIRAPAEVTEERSLAFLPESTGPKPWTPAERLLLDVLRAVGNVDTHDRQRLGREIGAWFQQNVADFR